MINNKYPNISPSLNLDFTNSNTIDPRISFSRASAATYYDGKTVAKAEENLLLGSQDFNGSWGKTNITVTANAVTAPDGSVTASKIIATATAGYHGSAHDRTITQGLPYTLSVYAKTGEYTKLHISDGSVAIFNAAFDLNGGTVISSGGTGIVSTTVVGVGNGWYRCSVTFNTTFFTSFQASIVGYPDTGATVGIYGTQYTGDGTSGIYIWGAQLEQRSQVTAYTPTTTQPITNYIPVLQTALANVPRIDHDPVTGECKGLLIEEQRTNLFTYSEFGSGLVGPVGLITLSTMFGPTGLVNAARFSHNGATDSFVYKGAAQASVTNTVSVYVKMDDGLAPNIVEGQGSHPSNDFAIVVAGNTAPVSSYQIQHVGNSVYRVSASAVAGVTNLGNNGIVKYQGNSPRKFTTTAWQLEAGSFPTSYIKTEASQVTRAADSAQMTGANFSSWWNPSSGTSFAEFSTLHAAGVDTKTKGVFGVGPRLLYLNGDNTVGMTNGVTPLQQGTVSLAGVASKAASSYSTSANAVSFNGLAAVNNTAGLGTINSATSAFIGFDGGSVTVLNGCIKRITYYPKRLTDAQLQALTA